jgi:serine/threonine protein kinase
MGQGKYGKVFMAKHKEVGFICALKAISKTKIK